MHQLPVSTLMNSVILLVSLNGVIQLDEGVQIVDPCLPYGRIWEIGSS